MLYIKLLVIILATIIVLPVPGYGDVQNESEEKTIYAYGIVKRQGITTSNTFNYGTHSLRVEYSAKIYALRSNRIHLDQFVDKAVLIKGTLVPGYPVEFGPDYLDVESVNGN